VIYFALRSIDRNRKSPGSEEQSMVEEIIEIDQYLDIRTKKKKGTNHVGNCLTCGVEVPWRWNRVESHKRSGKCANQQPEEYALFKRLKSRPSSSQSGDGGSEHNQSTPEALAMYRNLAIQEQSAAIDYVITAQQDEADKLMAAWILQAGVPLTAVESLTFHGLLTVLRPSYSITSTAEELFGKFIEKSGVTRDQSICAMFNGDPVVLVVDGWSAARPDGLISFVLTGRMHERPVLYKVFDGRQVEGQPEAIANEIIKVT
jgi:hypothetical protein